MDILFFTKEASLLGSLLGSRLSALVAASRCGDRSSATEERSILEAWFISSIRARILGTPLVHESTEARIQYIDSSSSTGNGDESKREGERLGVKALRSLSSGRGALGSSLLGGSIALGRRRCGRGISNEVLDLSLVKSNASFSRWGSHEESGSCKTSSKSFGTVGDHRLAIGYKREMCTVSD
jgi:hypothetical protein